MFKVCSFFVIKIVLRSTSKLTINMFKVCSFFVIKIVLRLTSKFKKQCATLGICMRNNKTFLNVVFVFMRSFLTLYNIRLNTKKVYGLDEKQRSQTA